MRSFVWVADFKRLMIAAVAATAVLAGCAEQPESALVTSCDAGTAAIGIMDGLVSRLCGCAEVSSNWVSASDGITCTVAQNSVVVFNYLGFNDHQMISKSGSPQTFVASPPSFPRLEAPVRVHAVVLEELGTYQFTDSFDSATSGQIIVQ